MKFGSRALTRRHWEVVTGLLFAGPALLYMLLLIGYPIVYNIVLSLKNVSEFNLTPGAAQPFVGFKNYIAIFHRTAMRAAVWNTFYYTFACMIFQFLIGLFLALLFHQKYVVVQPLRGLLVISWIMPLTVTALLFKYMLTANGVLNMVLEGTGLTQQPMDWLVRESTAIYGPIIANIWVGIPFNMLLLGTGLTNIPEEVYESASIEGAGTTQKFFHLTLPYLRPAMLAVLVVGFVYTFRVFDLIFVMTDGGPVNATEVLATYAYKVSFRFYQFGEGAAVANVLFVILVFVASIYLRLVRREEVS